LIVTPRWTRREGRHGETRRLAAVTAIVLIGYSRVMGEDKARTARVARGIVKRRSATLFHRGIILVGSTEVRPLSRPDKVVQCA
jgi:hypothetical protein